ncbi:MAG: N-acetylmuramoyl-L-alanine amidase family protein [Spirochaetota bacterium]
MKKSGHILLLFMAAGLSLFSPGRSDGASAVWSIPSVVIEGRAYASLYDIAAIPGIRYSFDPLIRRGRIFRKEHQAVFMEDCSVMVLDGQLVRSSYPVDHIRSETLIPEDMFLAAMQQLFPEYDIIGKGASYSAQTLTPQAQRAKTEKKTGPVNPPASKKTDRDEAQQSGERDILLSPSAPERIGFIIVDAGHGGKDPGAVGKGKTYEKDITLSLAKKLGRILQKENKGIKVFYTRSHDTFIELGGRTEIANRKLTRSENGLFISIHVNASIIPKMSGYETYFLSQNPTNAEARSTAALENDVVILENPGRRKSYDDVEYIEALMVTTQIQKESRMLAEKIQGKMKKSLKEFQSRGVKTADFFVLRGALMPAVLIEAGYITNKKECSRLKEDTYQEFVAASIADGISGFLRAYNGK